MGTAQRHVRATIGPTFEEETASRVLCARFPEGGTVTIAFPNGDEAIIRHRPNTPGLVYFNW